MTQSTGKTGRGVKVEISDGLSPETWTRIGNLVTTGFTGRDADEIDFTTLASTGGFREFRQGFKDPGNVPIEFHYDPSDATHQDILSKFLSGALFEFRINYFDAGFAKAERGTAFVKNPGDLSINVNDPMSSSATLRVTGATFLMDVAS